MIALLGKIRIPELETQEPPLLDLKPGIGLLAELADAVDSKSIVLPPNPPEKPALLDESAPRLPSACPDRLPDADLLEVLSVLPSFPSHIQLLLLSLVSELRSLRAERALFTAGSTP